MALYPYQTSSQEVLQPGARGGLFHNNGIPGFRQDEERINRSNSKLNVGDHDVLNIKYGLDPRLPKQFSYGWAYGYNKIVVPKGRILAVDPNLVVMDTDTNHFHNAVTLANGGMNVELNGIIWQETSDDIVVDEKTGFMKAKTGQTTKVYRPANIPIGVLERNEYTRDADAFNGIMLGPIRTDCIIELPWFLEQAKAEMNPWGSGYGALQPGDLVKSDSNGRFMKSPLSDATKLAAMTAQEVEKERQQIIGTIYHTDKSLIPEGAPRFAQWALEDRKKFGEFNPLEFPTTGRAGEDFVTNPPTAYQSDFTYPGYPYDKNFISSDLHMLASSRLGAFNPRIDEAHRLDRGIPGLTDGFNAVILAYGSSNGSNDITLTGDATMPVSNITESTELSGNQILIRVPETTVESVKIKLDTASLVITKDTVKGQTIGNFELDYVDLSKGLIGLVQKTAVSANKTMQVLMSYTKRGAAGVPTNLDWDGCIGTIKVLMQK